MLSLTVAELCRQEAVTSGERARILCRSWNDAVKTYDEELRRLRLRASLAEEMAHSCAAHRQAAMRAQKTAERDARAVRKAMLGMAMEEEEPAKLRMRIKELEDLEVRCCAILLCCAVTLLWRIALFFVLCVAVRFALCLCDSRSCVRHPCLTPTYATLPPPFLLRSAPTKSSWPPRSTTWSGERPTTCGSGRAGRWRWGRRGRR